MQYVSIDIETTGLDPETCQVIEFGAVIDDTNNQRPLEELPRFHAYVEHELYRGEPFALAMHAEIFRRLANKPEGFRFLPPEDLGVVFWNFIDQHLNPSDRNSVYSGKITVAGKNFGSFDNAFLKKLPDFYKYVQVHHRSLDPAVLFWNPAEDDKLPGLEACLARCGLAKEVNHTAVEDALDVVKVVRAWVNNGQQG